MPRLPRVSGKDLVRALNRAGFKILDQTGSHVYLHKYDGSQFGPRVTIPVHGQKTLAPKTLKSILAAVGISVQNLATLL